MARKSVPPKDMVIGHLDTGYWHLVSDPRSAFDDGLVANLGQGLSWLNVSGSLFGVPPGRYWVQWSYNLRNPTAVVGTQFRVATFSRDLVPVWHYETKSSIDYTPGTFRKFLHHTTATNKELLDPNEVFIFQLPQVLVVEENKPTVFVQMREHNTHKDGIMILFLRLVLAGDDEDDVKAEREDVEEEEEEEVDAEVARYEYEEVDNFSDQGEDGDNDGEYVDYGESDDDAENGDEGGHDGDGEPVAVDNGGYANGSSSTLSPNVDQDEDEDSNARPYFIRFAERNSHSGVSILDI
ncbi:hypothetical protein BGZ95_011729 [Linnemannia exigua]|uniref:Uncharacterized protein n=1 Tax=Linnemannia exigua TaxID=604196 RepID=A0AAD4D9I6_9FUNG|nr:hypothetical protein BGZ95_011729 [Linnemannia exigua]